MKVGSNLTFSPSTLLPLLGLRGASLLAVILLVGCAPAATPAPVQPEASVQPAPTQIEPTVPVPTATVAQAEAAPTEALPTEPAPTEAPTEVPQVVATSRGPNLEATDPNSYMRASGGLQLLEFFAFW